MKKIIQREEARDKGETRYFTGSPCKRGHIAERYVLNNGCIECGKENVAANREKIIQRRRAWRMKKPDSEEQRRKNAERSRKWREANPQRAKELQKRCRPPGSRTAEAAKRKADKRNATPPWVDKRDIKMFYDLAKQFEKMVPGEIVLHVDHIAPIRGRNVCGLHVPWNLQILEATENLRKAARLVDEAKSLDMIEVAQGDIQSVKHYTMAEVMEA